MIAFAAATLVLLVIAAFGASNYYQYYPAITQIQVRVSSLQTTLFNNTGVLTLQVRAAFSVANPTGYTGLSLSHFESTYDVIGIYSPTKNDTFLGGPVPYTPAAGPLNPGNTVNVVLPAFNSTSDAARVAGQPRTKIQFVFHLDFVLSGFLNKVALVQPAYDCTSSGDPATCNQIGLNIITAPGGGIGGGGG